MGSVYEIILNNIIMHMEKGTIPWRSGCIKKHFNGFNKREYQGINQLLLSLDTKIFNYSTPIWFSFKQVKELGCSIKKGAKSSIVVFSKKQEAEKKKDEEEENDSIEYFSESESENVKKKDSYYLLRYYRVFNIDDVEGIDRGKYLHIENETKEKPEQIVTKMEKTGLKIKHMVSNPCYIKSYDEIRIPPINYFESSESYYNSLFHEIVHATGHKTRLNRKSVTEDTNFGSEIYSYEELVAEIGSSFLMGITGLDINYENSAAYIKGWISFLKDNKKAIFQASSDARKSVDYIMQKSK